MNETLDQLIVEIENESSQIAELKDLLQEWLENERRIVALLEAL